MNFFRLLSRLGSSPMRRLVIGAAASALSSTMVLAIVNIAAAQIAARKSDVVNLWMAALFIAGVLLYAAAETWVVSRLGADVEEAIDGLRMRLLDRVRRADLLKLESFGETPLFESITQNCQVISMNSQFLALSLRSVLLIVAVMLYIASISLLAFGVITITLAAGAMAYRWLGHSLDERQQALVTQESALFESVSDLFDGFKEQRLSSARSRDLNGAFGGVSVAMTRARNEVHLHGWQQFVFGETVYNLMPGDGGVHRAELFGFLRAGGGEGDRRLPLHGIIGLRTDAVHGRAGIGGNRRRTHARPRTRTRRPGRGGGATGRPCRWRLIFPKSA